MLIPSRNPSTIWPTFAPTITEVIIEKLEKEEPYPVKVEQLQVIHPGTDDDGLWFINVSGHAESLQIEPPEGNYPFFIESNSERAYVFTVDQVVQTVRRLLPTK